ncbi:putative sugar O-methyltransferase [Streptosporangium sp. DT93]|uniref:putative sugar O-methyltransferase n=1 Tax=Streptosporangium sp. DT93 TaxID=3393428 RepID=UPI003CF5B94C
MTENPVNGRSALWEHINNNHVTRDSADDLSTFKSSAVNYKLALWNPEVNGVRYLKALTYNLGRQLTPDNLTRLRRIGNREIGAPFSVRVHGERVCMDYLQAVYELEFIGARVDLDGAAVLEIGAGYGRTCHALLSNHDLASYHIVDLQNSLELARSYLKAALTAEQFARVVFVPAGRPELLPGSGFDLCLNIDSFAEMDAGTVHDYLALIDRLCRYFYVKNPVGKYLDRGLDGHAEGEHVVRLALATGLLTDVIDIHDSDQVEAMARAFVAVYRPADRWRPVADAWGVPWSYYWQALYHNEEPGR